MWQPHEVQNQSERFIENRRNLRGLLRNAVRGASPFILDGAAEGVKYGR
jgi:hypothetical protein